MQTLITMKTHFAIALYLLVLLTKPTLLLKPTYLEYEMANNMQKETSNYVDAFIEKINSNVYAKTVNTKKTKMNDSKLVEVKEPIAKKKDVEKENKKLLDSKLKEKKMGKKSKILKKKENLKKKNNKKKKMAKDDRIVKELKKKLENNEITMPKTHFFQSPQDKVKNAEYKISNIRGHIKKLKNALDKEKKNLKKTKEEAKTRKKGNKKIDADRILDKVIEKEIGGKNKKEEPDQDYSLRKIILTGKIAGINFDRKKVEKKPNVVNEQIVKSGEVLRKKREKAVEKKKVENENLPKNAFKIIDGPRKVGSAPLKKNKKVSKKSAK